MTISIGMQSPTPKDITPKPDLSDDARALIAALAKRQNGAQGLLMAVITRVGGQVENGIKALPAPVQDRLTEVARGALTRSYDMAHRSRNVGPKSPRAHKVAATMTGALGGVGGLATSVVELPIAITTIFRAVQLVAADNGFDPDAEETRLECLQVFGAGAPGDDDDGIDTAFIGARMALTGSAINGVIARIAPRVATVLGQKLASQTVPVLGALAGAGTNYAFVDYYTEIAQVHFGLKRLAADFDTDQVADAFHEELARLNRPLLRA